MNKLQVSCASMDCTSSVSGLSLPNMVDSCCSRFQSGVCNSPLIQTLPPMEEGECQKRCRMEKNCRFYSSSPNGCILHSSCSPERTPCQGCRSGPKRPPLDKLPGNCGDDVTTPSATTTPETTSTTETTSSSTTAINTFFVSFIATTFFVSLIAISCSRFKRCKTCYVHQVQEQGYDVRD